MRFFHHLVDAGIGAVGFIHHDDHRHLGRQCFTEYETSLRQGAFRGVDKQHHTVHHGQCTFHFPTEVCVAGGINDVDDQVLTVLANPLAADSSVFCQNGDAFFFLEVTRVHDAVDEFSVGIKGTGLAQHGVDKGGFSVVNVRDDGNVSELCIGHWGGHCWLSPAVQVCRSVHKSTPAAA